VPPTCPTSLLVININIGRRSRSDSQGHSGRAMIGGAARKIIGLSDKPVLVPDLT